MTTIDRPKSESTFSSDAIGLLDCFSCGFDDLLGQIAEDIAVNRTPTGEQVEISKHDVEQAAKAIFDAVQRSDLSDPIKQEVATMLDCIRARCAE
jgi:hypothetical protein